jgi:hypothetical protein
MNFEEIKIIFDFISSLSWPMLALGLFCYYRTELTSLLKALIDLLNKVNKDGVEVDSPLVGNIKVKGNKKPPKKS